MSATTSFIDEMLDPLTDAFSPAMAEKVVNLQPTTAESQRMEHLAAKANEGALSAAEEAEYRTRVTLGDLISIMKLKARQYLDHHGI